MYLTEAIGEWPMVGFLPGRCFDAGKLTRFGYVTLSSQRENLLCGAGEEIRGHEFHRWDCTCPGGDLTARKPTGPQLGLRSGDGAAVCGVSPFPFPCQPVFCPAVL